MYGRLLSLAIFAAVPIYASAGVVGQDIGNADMKDNSASQNYELRCWQYGRLLFTEKGWAGVSMGPESKNISFVNTEGSRDKLYLFDLNNATCIYRSPR